MWPGTVEGIVYPKDPRGAGRYGEPEVSFSS